MQNVQQLIQPTANDKVYDKISKPIISLILRTDSYKFGHSFMYPKNMIGMSSYGTARVDSSNEIIMSGIQKFVNDYLTTTLTMGDIEEAEQFAIAHFGYPLFAKDDWVKVVTEHGGFLPITIRAVPEGMPVRGKQPLYTVTAFGSLAWLSSYIETAILRGVWYPTTIATLGYDVKKKMKRYYEMSGADMNMLNFGLHSFAGRGVTCGEQAEIGDHAHTINFSGTDTIEGIMTSRGYYDEPMSAYSVFATEHSIQCSYGKTREGAIAYFNRIIEQAKPGRIYSFVIDGFDMYREVDILCGELKDAIIATGAKFVFRPDSGDMMETVPYILKKQKEAFGYTTTSTGHYKINHVGLLQGDGVNHNSLISLLGKIVVGMNFSADNLVFGSGGALLQKVDRDTLKFAQKAAAILVKNEDGTEEWVGVAKDPITDPGKKSDEGVLTLLRNKVSGELVTGRLDLGFSDEFEDVHRVVYHNGKVYNKITMAEVRKNTGLW